MKITHLLNRLSWKTTLLLAGTILMLTGFVLAQYALVQPTQTGTKALKPEPIPTSHPVYPHDPPVIDRLEPWYGKPGDTVRLRGVHFGEQQWASNLKIGSVSVPASSIEAWSDTAIDFKLPSNVKAGAVNLTVNSSYAHGPPLSIYYNSLDPYLSLTPTAAGYRLSLENAPVSTLHLTFAGQDPALIYDIKDHSSILMETVTLPILVNAILVDSEHSPLPLYLDALSQTLMNSSP